MIPLLERQEGDDLIAFGGEVGVRTRSRLWRDVATMAAVLPPTMPKQRILLVFEQDRYFFLVALLAVWARGHRAIIPPDNRRATLTRLNRGCDLVVHDTHSGLGHQVAEVLRGDTVEHGPDVGDRLEAQWSAGQIEVELYGAGWHGEEEAVVVGADGLHRELERLQLSLPWPAGGRVASSVPIGSRYGLICSALLPLATSGAFYSPIRVAPDRWPEVLNAERIDVLVTSCRDLRRGTPRPDLPALSLVLSSGAPLPRPVAASAAAALGSKVVDLMTATAVGAIAKRFVGSEEWTTLEGVELAASDDGHLLVGDGSRPVQKSDDLIEVTPGSSPIRFHYRGRQAEWLPAPSAPLHVSVIEAEALSIPGANDAAVAVAPTQPPRALVCVASSDLDADAVRVALADRLRRRGDIPFDAAVVSELPVDGLGRFPIVPALQLFGRGPDGTPRTTKLTIERIDVAPESASFRVRVPESYRWFDGHFEQYPVLPAAVQLHEIVLPCARQTPWGDRPLGGAQRLKFTGRIGPGADLTVSIRPYDGGVSFEIMTEGRSCSSGRLRWQGEGS